MVLAGVRNGSVHAVQPGQAAPECELRPFPGGERQLLSDLRGQVLYLDFWASWCTSCVKSFPFLNALHRDFSGRGLQVLGVNLDERAADAQAFLKRYDAQFPLAVDSSGDCPRRFAVRAMPTSYVIDRYGIVRYVSIGFREGHAPEIRSLLEALLSEP